jgi:hypothetical protein
MKEVPMSTVHQSRWGLHPCSYEDFRKIKLLHKHYWLAKRAIAAWDRWNRKLPHNRVIRKQNGVILPKPIPMVEPLVPSIYRQIVKKPIVPLYQQARHPQPTTETVHPLSISMHHVNDWLNEIEAEYIKKSA